mgnify:CR=1 FL=1
MEYRILYGSHRGLIPEKVPMPCHTGGQASKSTPRGAIAQFAAGGKEGKKKDLAAVVIGANPLPCSLAQRLYLCLPGKFPYLFF